ncbi:MAG: hypothetical protein AB7N80_15985 [Bdellovibrionales bacterium]
MRGIAWLLLILTTTKTWAQNPDNFTSLTNAREQIQKATAAQRTDTLDKGIARLRERIHEMKTKDPLNPQLTELIELRMTLSSIAVVAKNEGIPTAEECSRTRHDVSFMLGFNEIDETTKQEGEEATKLIQLFCPQPLDP